MTELEPYSRFVQLKKSHGKEWKGCCPFHKEDTPSFFVNEETLYYWCAGCGKSGGTAKFLKEMGQESEKSIFIPQKKEDSFVVTINNPISPVIVEQLHKNLINDMQRMEYVLRERMISFFVVKKFLIGWDAASERYAFPIRSFKGNYVNIKLHNSGKIPKSCSWEEGRGKNRLFPVSALMKNRIVFCEGEFDCMLLHTLGINSITRTAGANSWDDTWAQYFVGKEVKILFDSDKNNAGQIGAEKVKEKLGGVASVEIIKYDIPLSDSIPKLDVTNYVKLGKNIMKLLNISRR